MYVTFLDKWDIIHPLESLKALYNFVILYIVGYTVNKPNYSSKFHLWKEWQPQKLEDSLYSDLSRVDRHRSCSCLYLHWYEKWSPCIFFICYWHLLIFEKSKILVRFFFLLFSRGWNKKCFVLQRQISIYYLHTFITLHLFSFFCHLSMMTSAFHSEIYSIRLFLFFINAKIWQCECVVKSFKPTPISHNVNTADSPSEKHWSPRRSEKFSCETLGTDTHVDDTNHQPLTLFNSKHITHGTSTLRWQRTHQQVNAWDH